MKIIWAGQTIGRIKFNKIQWRCDVGHLNISLDTEGWDRILTCQNCSRRYEVSFRSVQDAITS